MQAMAFMLLLFAFLFPCCCAFPLIYPSIGATNSSRNTTDLFVAVMMSFRGTFLSSGTIPGIQIALDLINKENDLLPGYKLHYIALDSKCNHTVALDTLFKQLISDTQRIGVVGAGCSVATEPTAEISHYYNITQVSCASSSHNLANRVKYKAYFQMLPSAINLVPAIGAVCMQYRWRHIGIIAQDENLFTQTVSRLTSLFLSENITWELRKFQSSAGPLSLGGGLFESRERIVFLAMYPGHALSVICEAYKKNRVYPRYTFIIYGWYSPNWWVPTSTSFECTRQEIESVLHYSIAVLQHQFGTNNAQATKSGISYNEYEAMYLKRLSDLGYKSSTHSIQCFDGVWAFALALNQTITELARNATLNMLAREDEGLTGGGTDFRIENATYKNNVVQQIMFKHLERTNFLGITGNVSFASDGIRTVNRLRVFQYRYKSGSFGPVEFASVPAQANYTTLQYYSGESDSTVWQFEVPYDGLPENEIVSVPIPVSIIYSLLAGAGMVFGIISLVFLIAFRKRKLVRLMSPKLNILVIAGGMIMYFSIVLYTLPVYDSFGRTFLCNLETRVFSLGYTLCFSTILAKMWRVYYIFTNPKPKRKAVKDWHLALFVLAAVLIDLFLLGLLTIYKGGRQEAYLVKNDEKPSEERGTLGYITDYYVYTCDSHEHNIWFGIVFGFKAILQVAALFLAFGIRKVKVKGLNDSKFVGLMVYISSIILTIQIIVAVTLDHYQSAFSILFGTCILISTSVILGLLIFPQMIGVYRDPDGKDVFTNDFDGKSHNTLPPTVNSTSFTSDIISDVFMNDKQKIEALVQKIHELQGQSQDIKKKNAA